MNEGYRTVRLGDPSFRLRVRTDYSNPAYLLGAQQSNRRGLISDFVVKRDAYPVKATQPRQSSGYSHSVANLNGPEASLQSTFAEQTERETKAENKRLRLIRKVRLFYKAHSKTQMGLICLAILMLAFGGYMTLTGWRYNHIAQVQAAKLTAQANNAAKKGTSSSSSPSTIKPSASAVASYTVAPDLPKYLIIPKLGVNAEIRSVGLTSSGALGVPDNVYYTDWYNESALPGQQGAMLIDGHVSSWTARGVFYGLKTLVPGDIIKVQRGDNTVFTYKVVKSQVYPSSNVNMAAAMTPVVPGRPGLNLITCTGDVIPGTSKFNERILVFATQISP